MFAVLMFRSEHFAQLYDDAIVNGYREYVIKLDKLLQEQNNHEEEKLLKRNKESYISTNSLSQRESEGGNSNKQEDE